MRLIAFFGVLFLGLQVKADTVSVEGACDSETRPRVVTEPGTWVVSPNYPLEYPPNSLCEWVYAPEGVDGQVSTITFSDFGVEDCADCTCDAVEIYDGENDESELIGTYCGTTYPDPVLASGTAMFVRFRSDESVEIQPGFRAQFTSDEPACSSARPRVIRDHEGNITSPNYPNDYPTMALCEWLFDAPAGWVVELTVTTFETEDCCTCDYLQVFNGDSVAGRRFGRWFNVDRVPVITSSGDKLYVQFRTDSSINAQGFHAEFRMYSP